MSGPLLLDLRGMRCPWPALRVARAIHEASAQSVIVVVADDPIAPREIGAVAAERGWAATPEPTEIGPGIRLTSDG